MPLDSKPMQPMPKITVAAVVGGFVVQDNAPMSAPRMAHTPDQLSSMIYSWAIRHQTKK